MADYVELAVHLAHDLPRLAKWRAELRGQVARSPLCDGPRFAANLMTALRSIWQEWVAALAPAVTSPRARGSPVR